MTTGGGYPRFIEEMRHPSNRAKLRFGLYSGYAFVAAFAILAIAADLQGLVSVGWSLYALIAAKVVTNTAAMQALRVDRGILEASALNTVADVVLMTAAIYLTGGPLSPLFSIYVIEITVVALLSNVGITALVGALVLVCYASMSLLMITGVLPAQPQPFELGGGALDAGYVLTDLFGRLIVIGALTLFIGLILRLLRDRERRLADRTSELVAANEQKSRFMANVTHELRTPIHGILGLSELVTEEIYGPITDKQRRAHAQITQSARSLLAMVDDLLQLSKHEAGKLEVDRSPVDIADLIPEVVGSISWMLGTVELGLEHHVDPGVGIVETDAGKLRQILVNLLSNAVKFTPEGGTVSVSARRSGDRLELRVADTGHGIAATDLDAIFDEFRQLDGSMERSYGGVGLGLPLVKRLVDLLGGEISVTSSVGEGSQFTVTLPA